LSERIIVVKTKVFVHFSSKTKSLVFTTSSTGKLFEGWRSIVDDQAPFVVQMDAPAAVESALVGVPHHYD
jgi:hypothetical protein